MEEAPASVPTPEEIVVVGEESSSKDQTHIVKGKRTKRQRVQSPSPIGRTNSSSGDKDNTNSNEYEYQDGLLEEEDEDVDMANCLILLAQGQSRISPHKQDITDLHHHHSGGYKFNSRKLIETASNGTGKAGYYVYECKTCNRTFPSFQALGGHRASHKKLNNKSSSSIADEKKQFFVSSDEELDGHYKNISSLSLQLSHNTRNLYKGGGGGGNNNKVHECSVCGAEFTSGQALGGHMRRHRSSSTTVGTTNNNKALTPTTTTTKATMEVESEQVKQPRKVLSLDLDLNLPPSTTENNNHNSESKFVFASKQQQQQQQQSPNTVFSASALVDCHY